jgi:hypothetical protein
MRKLATIGLAALLALSLASTLLANDGKAKMNMRVSGEVVTVDAATRTLTVREKKGPDNTSDFTFVLAEDAKVTVAGKSDSLDSLKAGDLVNVKYRDDGDTHTAVEVDGRPAAVPK